MNHSRFGGAPLACAVSLALLISGAAPAYGRNNATQPDASLPNPLTLESALSYALAHSPSLRRTREEIREQDGVLVEARAAQLPAVIASGDYTRVDDELKTSPLASNDAWSVSITGRQLLYAGGGVKAQVQGQRELVEAAKLTFTAALNDTELDVTQQFYDVLLARELIGVQEEALQVLEAALVNARHRRDAGTGPDFDVLRAEVAVSNAKPALIRSRNAYRVTQDQLRATLGAPAADFAAPTELHVEGPLSVAQRGIELADAVLAARAHRPELLRQERFGAAAEQAITTARSGYKPTLRAVAGYEWARPSLSLNGRTHLDGWRAGVQADWAIFDGRATAGRVAQARSRAAQTRLSGDELALAIEVEVRRAYSSLVESNELLVASERVIEQARESVRLAQARVQAGTATQLDVLEAQSSLTLAQSNFAQAQHDYAVGLAALDRATGQPPRRSPS